MKNPRYIFLQKTLAVFLPIIASVYIIRVPLFGLLSFLYSGLPFLGGGSESTLLQLATFILVIISYVLPVWGYFIVMWKTKKLNVTSKYRHFIIGPFILLSLFLTQLILLIYPLFEPILEARRWNSIQTERCENKNGDNEYSYSIKPDDKEGKWLFSCKEGKFHGSFKIIEDGYLKREIEYQTGRKVKSTRYDNLGNVYSVSDFKTKEGLLYKHFPSESSEEENLIYSQGPKEKEKTRDLERQLTRCKNKDGENRIYYNNSDNLFMQFSCKEGKFDGTYYEYFSSTYGGGVRFEENYSEGFREGSFKINNSDGSLDYEAYYNNGDLVWENRY